VRLRGRKRSHTIGLAVSGIEEIKSYGLYENKFYGQTTPATVNL
jgi:hypothetical protein